jgi:hypothetical protein
MSLNVNLALHEQHYSKIVKIIDERYPRIKGAYCASIAYGIIDYIDREILSTAAPAAPVLTAPTYELASALNSLRWMLNKSDECDTPNMRATTLLDKHHSKVGRTIRQDLEYLWSYFNPNRPEMTAALLHGAPTVAAPVQAEQAQAEPVAYLYEWIGEQGLRKSGALIARTADELGGNIDMYPTSWKRLGPLYDAPVIALPAQAEQVAAVRAATDQQANVLPPFAAPAGQHDARDPNWLLSTMDGKDWADEFCRLNNAANHGMMLAWFCNAIMVGYDTGRRHEAEEQSSTAGSAKGGNTSAERSELATKEAAAQVPSQWISVEDRLPESPESHHCLATYRNRAGKLRIIRATYVRQFEVEATGDECDSEYNEADDREYLKAGWLERIDNWGEYSSVYVSKGPVTHWMPIPAAPSTTPSNDTSALGDTGGAK